MKKQPMPPANMAKMMAADRRLDAKLGAADTEDMPKKPMRGFKPAVGKAMKKAR